MTYKMTVFFLCQFAVQNQFTLYIGYCFFLKRGFYTCDFRLIGMFPQPLKTERKLVIAMSSTSCCMLFYRKLLGNSPLFPSYNFVNSSIFRLLVPRAQCYQGPKFPHQNKPRFPLNTLFFQISWLLSKGFLRYDIW